MEFTWSTCLSSLFVSSFVLSIIIKRLKPKHGGGGKQPPGPPGFPVIGNVFDIASMPHQQLYNDETNMAQLSGYVLAINTMVVQSPDAASELFKNHDLAFCDRKVPDALTAWNYNERALSINAHGPYWWVLRRLYASVFFAYKRINDGAKIRQECADKMIQWIEDDTAMSLA